MPRTKTKTVLDGRHSSAIKVSMIRPVSAFEKPRFRRKASRSSSSRATTCERVAFLKFRKGLGRGIGERLKGPALLPVGPESACRTAARRLGAHTYQVDAGWRLSGWPTQNGKVYRQFLPNNPQFDLRRLKIHGLNKLIVSQSNALVVRLIGVPIHDLPHSTGQKTDSPSPLRLRRLRMRVRGYNSGEIARNQKVRSRMH